MSDAPLVNLVIDGKPVRAPAGTSVVEAARQAGVEIPHYCYHRRLSIAGNCRMCLVKTGMPRLGPDRKPELGPDGQPVIGFAPKLAIACNTPAAEGLVVRTRSEKVVKAREGVMEFLLVNHPLDCPICDQAGECRLQEFALDYGRGASRFREEKEHKPKRTPLGPKIMLDDERCILCSRCVRFMKEVAGQDCLGFVQRGSRSVLTCFPGHEPNTNYDLNIVDLCPVGALTSTQFRFRQRVWFLKETRTLCTGCARGCNVVAGARGAELLRLVPRDNEAVNQSWMCDQGRLGTGYVNDPTRLREPVVDGKPSDWGAALDAAAARLRAAAPGGIAIIGSARATLEEQYVIHRIGLALGGAVHDCLPRRGPADGFLMLADRNPNSRGARLTGIAAQPPGSALGTIAARLRAGSLRGLLVVGDNPAPHDLDEAALAAAPTLVALDILPTPVTARAHVVLPGASPYEKEGSLINADGRLQRLRPALPPPGDARADLDILCRLLERLGGPAWNGPRAVFAALVADLPALKGRSYDEVGELGLTLDLAPEEEWTGGGV